MALGVLWVVAGVLIALVVLMATLVAAVLLGGYLWLRRVFRKAAPAPLGHRPRNHAQGAASRPASATWPRAGRSVATGEIVDIEAREIPDPLPGPGR